MPKARHTWPEVIVTRAEGLWHHSGLQYGDISTHTKKPPQTKPDKINHTKSVTRWADLKCFSVLLGQHFAVFCFFSSSPPNGDQMPKPRTGVKNTAPKLLCQWTFSMLLGARKYSNSRKTKRPSVLGRLFPSPDWPRWKCPFARERRTRRPAWKHENPAPRRNQLTFDLVFYGSVRSSVKKRKAARSRRLFSRSHYIDRNGVSGFFSREGEGRQSYCRAKWNTS